MASNGAILPPLVEIPNDQKFDGGIKVAWINIKRKIDNALKAQGLFGYVKGTI
jgi:hypothetical protein